MLKTHCLSTIAVLVTVLVATSAVQAGKFNRVLDVGQDAPAWNDLIGVDGEQHSLADLKDAKAVVVVFTCNHCPVAQAYEDRLIKFAKSYEKKGVHLVAINVNNTPADRLDKMKLRAEKKGYPFPYLYDPSQEIARKYGATCTPHAFVLDQKRRIAYMGKIDDDMVEEKADEFFLKDAVEALLAGREPEVKETRQIGCGIQYESTE